MWSRIAQELRLRFQPVATIFTDEQRGKFVYYSINDERVDEILRLGDVLLADVAKGVYECTHCDEPKERS